MSYYNLENPHQNSWTDLEVMKLRELAADGNIPAREIALQIPGKSRNAILGKANRLGLHIHCAERNQYTSFWTQENLQKLERYRHSPLGYSNAEIAAEFGIGMSMLRRGLERMGKNGHRVRTRAVRAGRIKAPRPNFRKPPVLMHDLANDTSEAIARAVDIHGLKATSCRWPVQGSGWNMLYCGCEAIPGIPYCHGHARRAYAP